MASLYAEAHAQDREACPQVQDVGFGVRSMAVNLIASTSFLGQSAARGLASSANQVPMLAALVRCTHCSSLCCAFITLYQLCCLFRFRAGERVLPWALAGSSSGRQHPCWRFSCRRHMQRSTKAATPHRSATAVLPWPPQGCPCCKLSAQQLMSYLNMRGTLGTVARVCQVLRAGSPVQHTTACQGCLGRQSIPGI